MNWFKIHSLQRRNLFRSPQSTTHQQHINNKSTTNQPQINKKPRRREPQNPNHPESSSQLVRPSSESASFVRPNTPTIQHPSLTSHEQLRGAKRKKWPEYHQKSDRSSHRKYLDSKLFETREKSCCNPSGNFDHMSWVSA